MGHGIVWQEAPAELTLQDTDVHVWQTSLVQSEDYVARLFQILSPEEQAKAKRFRFPELQKHYIVGRGVLRELLGKYLNVPGATLEFAYGPQGKPMLAGAFAGHAIRFNVSHSGELALYAVTVGREVGVDIEYMKDLEEAESIAEHFFSPREVESLLSLPSEQRHEAFFNCWSRKEAFIKVTGKGVSYGLDKFAVTLAPNEPARLLWVESADASNWELHALDAAERYKAALCVEGTGVTLSCFGWN